MTFSYMRDALYVAMASQVLSIVTDWAWYLLSLVCASQYVGDICLRLLRIKKSECASLSTQVPIIGCYKLWTSVLRPMLNW